MQEEQRKSKAIDILNAEGLKNLEFLGIGNEGVVFHDENNVYKVIVPFFHSGNKYNSYRHLSFFLEDSGLSCFYKIDEIIETASGILIEKYPYEKSEKVNAFSEEECIEFLTQCWQKKIIVQDCKTENFIRVNGQLKLIDMDACTYYNDNLFLNTCARMYLYIYFKDSADLKKLQRSAINNFDLPELVGLREFVNKVFANIIFEESKTVIDKVAFTNKENLIYEEFDGRDTINFEKLFFIKLKQKLYLSDIQVQDLTLSDENTVVPKKILVGYKQLKSRKETVSLLIKTCAMDVLTVEQNIKHIVRQLTTPNTFNEVVVSIDSKKLDFLRQYNNNSDYDKVIEIVQKLENEQVIDRYVIFDSDKAEEINKNWFDIDSSQTHSSSNVPVASQLYAFEQCKSDYILQTDSDAMICRQDYNHNYLDDMIEQINKNKKVVSVGFNICNVESKQYFGFDNGGFVPEVRMCLFEKSHLLSLRPFPNQTDDDGRLRLTWYRCLEQFQKQAGYCSIRGGDKRTFFVHPQNYRKTATYSWMNILDRVEQNQIPECQVGHFDCEGSFFDWCGPKRDEEIVVLSCFYNVSTDRFLRFWYSLISQSYTDFGLILYDDCSDNGISLFIQNIIKSCKNVTYIRGRTRLAKSECEYLAIHNYCNNSDSIITCVDTDDALIGKDVLSTVVKKYKMWGVDVTCGRVHQTYRLQPYYRYHANFINPRLTGGNVWQHLKTFRKYLFDNIPFDYFKYATKDQKLYNRAWIDKCDDFAIMIPIVELSSSPYQMDFINYYYERDYEKKDFQRELKDKCIAEVLSKDSLKDKIIVTKKRKRFDSNFDRIEIDITFECNLKCEGCNRSCGSAPSDERMPVEDIKKFVNESLNNNHEWKLINILGGEPTLHPAFLEILQILQNDYASKYPDVIIQVVSNGISQKSRDLCNQAEQLKNVRIDRASFKTGNRIEYFTAFNDAPCDDVSFQNADFNKGCWVSSYCGIGLNKNGYFACSVCGGIDRVIHSNKGYNSFVELKDINNQEKHYNKFCQLCGNFKHYDCNRGDFIPRNEKAPFRNVISKTWQEIYKQYEKANNES